MRDAKQYQKDLKAEALAVRFSLPDALTASIIGLIVILTLCPSGQSQSILNCGDEVRIVSQTGEVLQGKLTNTASDSLVVKIWRGKFEFRMVALDDVANLYRVRRKTADGVMVGALVGAAVGAMWGAAQSSAESDSDGFEAIGNAMRTLAMTGGGAVLGGVIGGIVGHNTQRLGEVQLEATPMCISTMGEVEPVGVTFAVNF